MARIQYQPARKSKGFAPIQISTEGINRMREESKRIVRGLKNVREAEAKQRAAELASIKEDSAYQERILKENRNTLIQNEQNKQQQRAYNQETKQKSHERKRKRKTRRIINDFNNIGSIFTRFLYFLYSAL